MGLYGHTNRGYIGYNIYDNPVDREEFLQRRMEFMRRREARRKEREAQMKKDTETSSSVSEKPSNGVDQAAQVPAKTDGSK